ncbi:MAG TPA: Wzz/FepE/Etk N-terminal domain-containing protein [Gaiellaceae bacterium]|nr:Wzz/FepE/Etk N-terminal domain-containing protein [Gaiellaceae bacterium]
MTTPAPPARGFDPEAEQEVDFAKYVRLLAVRWWLIAAGVVAGAVIGYLVSLGGNQVYTASATVYLGQPYTPTGGALVQNLQTNPSAVATAVQSAAVQNEVANRCHAKPGAFAKGISTQAIATGSSATKGTAAQVNPLVKVSVQAKKGKVAACAANQLAEEVVSAKHLGSYAAQKIVNLERSIALDNGDIKTIETAIANAGISSTDKLVLTTLLRSDQIDKNTNSQLLLLAQGVERPSVYTRAAAHKTTARSRRNTVVIAALIGLILGALAALLWDSVVPRLAPRNGV